MKQLTNLNLGFIEFPSFNTEAPLITTFRIHSYVNLLIILCSIYSSSIYATTINLEKYIGGYSTELAGKPALTFKFTDINSDDYCNIITTEEHMFSSNNLLENINLSEKNFYLDCEVDGQFYMLSNHYRTYAQVLIKQPDIKFPMSMHIEAKLVTINGEYLNVISGDISLRK
ncbi:hypothetical protein Q4601_00545 [Shewanella sp. 1_MG-2023]|uniref:hypothetical protein n=1 Tax=unclassified Shewanella TaxID=196818 RepID=UPI0026E2D10A|nr:MULTISPECIES: hypothetical protein [unclassified Shewanella]MDO6610146.1 hypothetical protein [Shewanella sp. 7_MG-2023]MDO6769712.1 hypothetical protein [Shewanella sp. 2_MG-2023]MDO6792776.1 hypothetical protein [Shewanella sp. 1_MG-2023]